MDIIDIMLAKAMTPQGQIDTYAAKARKAAQDAASAVSTVEAAADEIAVAKEEAADLLTAAQEALETAQEAQINQIELYPSVGQNTDGTMTQKAITDALSTKVSHDELNNALTPKADKTYVDDAIAAIPKTQPSSGGVSNLGTDAAGHIVIVGEDGNIISGDITEKDIIEALLQAGNYSAQNAVGLEIDYANKAFERTQEAMNLSAGADFNQYTMYGGRMRCNVADDGTINAFYGDSTYTEDGSNGQVMVYQPKFYYQRIPLKTESMKIGEIVRKESILLSTTKQSGFKLHPIFDAGNGEELDYVLFGAYDGSNINNRLASVGGQKPLSNITLINAEALAAARGTGWHITNMAAESVQQMLEMVEFGTMNGQAALEAGISNITNTPSNINCGSITGSTAALGNSTGAAESTINEIDGTESTFTTAGRRAISYRGFENPWGNMWRFIGGLIIYGDGKMQGGIPHICDNYSYTTNINSHYHSVGFALPQIQGWISAMGYGNEDYDWVFMPAECASGANSAVPVGDNLWITANLNDTTIGVIGGSWKFGDSNGPFYYACDYSTINTSQVSYNPRLMFIPTKNNIYNANYDKWLAKIGG